MTARRAGLLAAVILGAVYTATLAPGVTFWDAGEFISAAHSLGIPHPPGTPLFVMLLADWARLLPMLPFAVRTNLFSACSTAIAGAIIAALVATSIRVSPNGGDEGRADAGWIGLAAALCAGAMFSVWSNATETEVYAAALLLAMITLWCAERAGRLSSTRWRVITAYLFGLAVPLHISALVAAPAAVYLAATRPGAAVPNVRVASAMVTAAVLAMALGTAAPPFVGVAAVCAVVTTILVWGEGARTQSQTPAGTLLAGAAGAVVLGATAVLFLLIRARHDPAINQGNPTTIRTLIDVIGRHQYDVAPLWPRRAPLWLQLANWFDYADWQTSLSLDPSVIPTLRRTLITVAFGIVAVIGAGWQHGRDRRGWFSVLILTVCGSLGVAVYLNLRAGPSFGWGILPDTAVREARERDYFFVLGFVGWGIWAGMGAVTLARRRFGSPIIGVFAAAVPIALNWDAVSRRHFPEAYEPRAVARALLESAPRDAVLFVAGDNDTYPLWYAQEVEHDRRDVTIVTLPLLPASWYVDELQRRHRLTGNRLVDPRGQAEDIARMATNLGRPVAAALTVTSDDRRWLGSCWRMVGLAVVAGAPPGSSACSSRWSSEPGDPANARPATGPMPFLIAVDSSGTVAWAERLSVLVGSTVPGPGVDPVDETFFNLLSCPRRVAALRREAIAGTSLDSLCNH